MTLDAGYTLAEMREAIDNRRANFTVLPSGRVVVRAGNSRAILERGEIWKEYREAVSRACESGSVPPVFQLAALAL